MECIVKLKAGDKLLCKETLIYDKCEQCFTQGKYYVIKKIFENGDIIIIDDVLDSFYFNLYSKDYDFSLLDHFYTPQEMRQFKLKKIDGIKSR